METKIESNDLEKHIGPLFACEQKELQMLQQSIGAEVNMSDYFTSMNDKQKEAEKQIEPLSNIKFSSSRALVPVVPTISHEQNNLPSFTNILEMPDSMSFLDAVVKELKLDKVNPLKLHRFSDSANKEISWKMQVRNFAKYKPKRITFDRTFDTRRKFHSFGEVLNASHREHRMRIAASTNNVETMEDLLNSNVSANNQDTRGRSPLHLAACRGYTEIVRLLLQHNANPNLQDCIGNTPLHLATLTNKVSVVTLLLEAGANVHKLDFRGFTPLYLAQTRLRLLQSSKCDDMSEVEKQMFEIANMLRVYLKKVPSPNESQQWNAQMEKINDIWSKLSLSSTNNSTNSVEEVQDDVRSLLESIQALNLS